MLVLVCLRCAVVCGSLAVACCLQAVARCFLFVGYCLVCVHRLLLSGVRGLCYVVAVLVLFAMCDFRMCPLFAVLRYLLYVVCGVFCVLCYGFVLRRSFFVVRRFQLCDMCHVLFVICSLLFCAVAFVMYCLLVVRCSLSFAICYLLGVLVHVLWSCLICYVCVYVVVFVVCFVWRVMCRLLFVWC